MKLSKFPSKKKLSKFRGNPFKDPWFCIWTHYYPIIVSGTNFSSSSQTTSPSSLTASLSIHSFVLFPPNRSSLHCYHHTRTTPLLKSFLLSQFSPTSQFWNQMLWKTQQRPTKGIDEFGATHVVSCYIKVPFSQKRVGKFVSRWSNDGGDLDARAVPPAKARP